MSFILRGFAYLPLIAAVNGLAMGSTTFFLDTQNLTSGWSAFWLLFWLTSIAALVVGALLAGPALALGKHLPDRKLFWLALIGVFTGPVPIILLDGRGAFVAETLLTFSALGLLSAVLWWSLVERHRPTEFAANA